MEQSGISRLPWRKFRNTYATILAQYQVNMKTISKCLGHYSPDFTSRIYVASQKQETYDISKIIEEYVLAHHLLSKEQGKDCGIGIPEFPPGKPGDPALFHQAVIRFDIKSALHFIIKYLRKRNVYS